MVVLKVVFQSKFDFSTHETENHCKKGKNTKNKKQISSVNIIQCELYAASEGYDFHFILTLI